MERELVLVSVEQELAGELVSELDDPAVGDPQVHDVGQVGRVQRRAQREPLEHVGVEVERVDRVELGHVDQVDAHQLADLQRDRVVVVVARQPVDGVELVGLVVVGVEAVEHHGQLFGRGPRLRRVDDHHSVEPAGHVLVERLDVAVVGVHAEGLGGEGVGAGAAHRDDLEDAVLVAGMDAVEVDGVRVPALVDQGDVDRVALGHPEHRARDGAVVGPAVPLHALGDVDHLLLDVEREVLDAPGLGRERRRRMQQVQAGLLGVRDRAGEGRVEALAPVEGRQLDVVDVERVGVVRAVHGAAAPGIEHARREAGVRVGGVLGPLVHDLDRADGRRALESEQPDQLQRVAPRDERLR